MPRMGGGPTTDAYMKMNAEERRKLEGNCSKYPGWISVTTGGIKDACEALQQLRAVNISVDHRATGMIQNVSYSRQKKSFNLVKPTIEEMGFNGDARPEKVMSVALGQGLIRPEAEIAVSLLIQNPQLLANSSEWAVVPHEPINGMFFLLSGRGNTESLCATTTSPSTPWIRYYDWPSFTRFIFVRPS